LIEKETRLKRIINFMGSESGASQERPEIDVPEQSEAETELELQDSRNDKAQIDTDMYEEEFVEENDQEMEIELKQEKTEFTDDEELVVSNIMPEDEEVEVHFLDDEDFEDTEEIYKLEDSSDKKDVVKLSKVRLKSFQRKDFSDSEKIYRCWFENCDANFPHRISLKRHMASIHNLTVSKSCCLICGQDFPAYTDFLTHSKIHRRFNCTLCQSSFSKSEALESHLERFHGSDDSHERPFFCPECNARFKRKEHLKSHVVYKHSLGSKF
jgi:hypothetical protein